MHCVHVCIISSFKMCILTFIEQVNYSFMHMIPPVKTLKKNQETLLAIVVVVGVGGEVCKDG